jgi:hypothetical protein
LLRIWPAGLVQMKGLGIVVAVGDIALDGGLEIDDRVKAAAFDAASVECRLGAWQRPVTVPSSALSAANSVAVPGRTGGG